MIWSNVAIAYKKVFNNALKLEDESIDKLPPIKLNHMIKMTDNFGMIQFANQTERCVHNFSPSHLNKTLKFCC